MSRLDSILSYVEELSERSDKLIAEVSDSYSVIDRLSALHKDISKADEDIEEIYNLMAINKAGVDEFSSLYAQSFYLESNLHLNDKVTNQMSFETLTTEFRMLMKKLEVNDKFSQCDAQDQPASSGSEYTRSMRSLYRKSDIPKRISLSNLKLKPIKCTANRRIFKKKSRYRLSGIYNINPIAYDGVDAQDEANDQDIHSVTDEANDQEIHSVTDEANDQDIHSVTDEANDQEIHSVTNEANDQEISVTEPATLNNQDTVTYQTPKVYPQSLISENTSFGSHMMEDHDVNTVATSPIECRFRSNSLPETPFSMHPPSNLGDLSKLAEGLEQLRNRRLDHFISCANMKMYDKKPLRSEHDDDETLNLEDHVDFDNMSMVSDFSAYSPEKTQGNAESAQCEPESQFEDFQRDFSPFEENESTLRSFDHFLRSSRLNLSNDMPNIKRTSSHDSIFNNSAVYQSHSYKFHNPASIIHCSSTINPTVEQVHSENSIRKNSSKSSATTKLLNEVIQRNNSSLDKTDEPPKSPFSLFTINSPRPPRKPVRSSTSTDTARKSLTETFLGLMSPKPIPVSAPVTEQSVPCPPIQVKSETYQKRLPVRIPRKDGYHSELIIGPNSTKIINHGESSVFRKPLITRVSHNSLQDAISSSIN